MGKGKKGKQQDTQQQGNQQGKQKQAKKQQQGNKFSFTKLRGQLQRLHHPMNHPKPVKRNGKGDESNSSINGNYQPRARNPVHAYEFKEDTNRSLQEFMQPSGNDKINGSMRNNDKPVDYRQQFTQSPNTAGMYMQGVDYSQIANHDEDFYEDFGVGKSPMRLQQQVTTEMKQDEKKKQQNAPTFVHQSDLEEGEIRKEDSDDDVICLDDIKELHAKSSTINAKTKVPQPKEVLSPKKHIALKTKSDLPQSVKEEPPAKKQAISQQSFSPSQSSVQQSTSISQQSFSPAQPFVQQSTSAPQSLSQALLLAETSIKQSPSTLQQARKSFSPAQSLALQSPLTPQHAHQSFSPVQSSVQQSFLPVQSSVQQSTPQQAHQSPLPAQSSAQQSLSTSQHAHQSSSLAQSSVQQSIPHQLNQSFLPDQSSAQPLPSTPQQPVHIHTLRPFKEVSYEDSIFRVDKTKPSFSIRICSFNILCEAIKAKRAHLYTDPQQKIGWNDRQKLISEDITLLNADIFCLQEVQEDHYTGFFEPFFNAIGFKSFFSKRDGVENVDGCLIAYRNDNRYKVLKFERLSYNRNAQNFSENNVGQLLLLEEISTGIAFLVVNTQLLLNLKRGDIKTGQIAFLLASIDSIESELSSKHNYAGVLLCGNFNFEPGSPLYNFIRNGQLHYSMYPASLLAFDPSLHVAQQQKQQQNEKQPGFMLEKSVLLDPRSCKFVESVASEGLADTFTHQQRYLSAYRHRIENDWREISTFNKYYGCPDFIFYSGTQLSRNRIGESRIMIKKLLMLPSIKAIRESCGPMPNQQCGSDHLPLMAEFTLV